MRKVEQQQTNHRMALRFSNWTEWVKLPYLSVRDQFGLYKAYDLEWNFMS